MIVPFEDATKYINVGGEDNLANLQILSEETILAAVKGRYEKDNIHTYVGDILIILNPYIRFPVYTDKIRQWYMGGQYPKDVVAPHPYKVADTAYENMCKYRKAQTFVISGESGAGKTETTKIIVSQIMHLCRAGKTSLEEKIKNLNPFLEAFGNAKTVMNNNSSRFGKYLELMFDDAGSICGASMSHYLLEKSRVAVRNVGEQNFHIFYQVYAGLAAKNDLADKGLSKPSANHYLNSEGAPPDDVVLKGTLETCGDGLKSEWDEVIEGMKYIHVEGEPIESLTKILAGIIIAGDFEFKDGGNDDSHITNGNIVDKFAALNGVDVDMLKTALTTTSKVTRGEKITKNLDVEKAKSNRDAMAKMIFNKIFVWIFELCNEILVDPTAASKDTCTIGVLDIFGFEVFKKNSIEQMCIDLTNEQLQGYFNHHIFVAEQEEYKAEGIDVAKISFPDNTPTLDMFLKKGGIFSILNEETRFPKATDLTFTQKCTAALSSHKSKAFKGPRSDRDTKFTVTHYAGQVEYCTDDFLEKNRDKLSDDITEVLVASGDALLAKLFDPTRPSNQASAGSGKKAPTLCSIFAESLKDLMTRMGKCQPHFIRCLKTNGKKKPHLWEEELVTRQLRYAGVLETIKIRKMGYSFRMAFGDFVKSYNNVSYHYHEDPPQTFETCMKILDSLKNETKSQKQNFDDSEVGKTKVFMKYYHADMLGVIAKRHSSAVSFLQKIVRGHVARQQYLVQRTAARLQTKQANELLTLIESHGEKASENAQKLKKEDEKASQDRDWLERVKMQAAMAEAEKMQAEEEAKVKLKAVENEPTEVKTKSVNGYFVWQRNEHLTLKKGALESPWRKKLDEATGRYYFKNTETKTTTWIDPRSLDFDERPHNPTECSGDQLPFGWDKAETDNGTVFYIDHVTNTHHRDHPKEEVARKIQQRKKLEADAKEETDKKLELINDLKSKRTLLTTQVGQAVDTASRESLEGRIRDITSTIEKETAFVEEVRSKIDVLDGMIKRMQETKHRECLTQG